MAAKTKAQLVEEIEVREAEIRSLKDEVKKLERFKQYETMTDEMAVLRDSFVNSGFSKTESFEMVKIIMQQAIIGELTKPVRRYTR